MIGDDLGKKSFPKTSAAIVRYNRKRTTPDSGADRAGDDGTP